MIGCILICSAAFAADEKEKVNLGQIVVTSSGKEESAFDYPGNVSVITSKDIERSNARFVYDLLRHEPGLYVVDQTHTGKAVTVDIRGFGDTAARNVLVMMDGRRLNEIDISGPDWAQIPLENIERIEIIRGGGSVLYGDNATAGVINIISKKGKGDATIGYAYETGSYRLNKQVVTSQGGHPFMQYNILGKYERTDGYRLNGYYEGYDYDGNTTFNPAEYLTFNVSGGYHKDWYGMPAGLRRTQMDQVGRNGSRTPYDWAKTETGFLKLSPKIDLKTGADINSIEADIWMRKKRTKSVTHSDWFTGAGLIPSTQASQIASAGGTFRYRIGHDFGPVSNEAIAGVDLFRAENWLLSVTPDVLSFDQLTITKKTAGVYGSDKMTIANNLILNGGYRYEWANYVFDQQDDINSYTENAPSESAVEIGAEYKYTDRGALYGRFSTSYRFPSVDEVYSIYTGMTPNLKQQTSETWEIGIKEDTLKYFMVKCALFLMNTHNEIYYDPTAGGGFGDNGNYDRTQRKGIELGLKSDMSEYLQTYFNYTFLNAHFKDGAFAGNKVPMVPVSKVNWGVIWTPFNFLDVHFWSDYTGIQYPINDQFNRQPKLKEYFVCNIKTTFKCKGWEIFAGINNMFNQTYSEMASASVNGVNLDYFPAPGTNWRLGASVKF
jgi:Outer membrane receptor for ferrienterochelin and colicins